ncbi:MAG: NAD(P)H-dependent oxidoreductase subunit E [Erysipelotrichaceae bacterium]|nr:NAD(P)H-dependent oxidoreductase subunit E [Erysipelotrichaceae bacterium]
MERKLNAASLQKIDEIVAKHRGKAGPVKLMLHDVQRELGYIPAEAMEKIAEASGVSPAEVYGVVTFYTQFTTQPKGKHVINVCLGTACYVKNSQALVDKAIELTGADINKTSEDGMFSVDATRCLGACGLAPVCIIDGRTIGNATPQKVAEEIAAIRAAEKVETAEA